MLQTEPISLTVTRRPHQVGEARPRPVVTLLRVNGSPIGTATGIRLTGRKYNAGVIRVPPRYLPVRPPSPLIGNGFWLPLSLLLLAIAVGVGGWMAGWGQVASALAGVLVIMGTTLLSDAVAEAARRPDPGQVVAGLEAVRRVLAREDVPAEGVR